MCYFSFEILLYICINILNQLFFYVFILVSGLILEMCVFVICHCYFFMYVYRVYYFKYAFPNLKCYHVNFMVLNLVLV